MGSSSSGASKARQSDGGGGGGGGGDTFDIPANGASIEQLKKWRQATLALNASRRFRYTLDLKKEQQKEEIKRKIRAEAHVTRAAYRFKDVAQVNIQTKEASVPHVHGAHGFEIKEGDLTALTRDHNYSALQQYGGISGVAKMLKTDIENGTPGDDPDLEARQNAFGSNTYPRKKGRSFMVFVWDACKNWTLIILMVAAVVSLALGIVTEGLRDGWYDGASIAVAVLLVVFVTATTDYKQSLQFQNLNEKKQNIQVEVFRGGRRIKVSIYDLVVGDVVPLNVGDQVPADGILISGQFISIDESTMTGESRFVNKEQKSPFMMAGCTVADGYGTMLVTTVGINTEWGSLMASISEDSGRETPLQVRLNGVATLIGIIGLSAAVLILIVLLERYFSGHSYKPDGSPQYVKGKMGVCQTIKGVLKIFIAAVTLVIVFVPEGLPLAFTLTLAFSMLRTTPDKALVRTLAACETMGSATVIVSEKTGMLTCNVMTVVEAYFGGKKMVPANNTGILSATLVDLIIEGIASLSLFQGEKLIGSPIEEALILWGLQIGRSNFSETRSKPSILQVFPFNSDKKRGGVAVHVGDSKVHIHWKGAAELILESCTDWLDADGSKHSMTPEDVGEFRKLIEYMAAASLRCIAFAYRPFEMSDVPNEDERAEWILPEDNLIMLGIVGLLDPCRPGVPVAISWCELAGIKVCMATGDNLQTARAVALECGVIDDPDASEPIIMDAKIFRALTGSEREHAAKKIRVMGRCSTNDKLLFVKALRSIGHVVAVTGNCTNDAPALHEADIGLSMGFQGTEVAKQSSDIIVLDDNFVSIVKVVRWGRSVYANIQKFTQFQLTVNVAALIITVVSAVSSGCVPLNAVQWLWVNIIVDTLGALALAAEPPNNILLMRPPVGRREPFITNIMWRNLLIMAFFQVAVILTLNFKGPSLLQLEHDNPAHAERIKNTFIFNTFVLCQVFNGFNARKPEELNILKGITGNKLFMAIIAITIVLQVLIIEFLGKFMSTVRLSWQLWLVSVGLAFVSWPLALLGKLIPVPEWPLLNLLMCRCPRMNQVTWRRAVKKSEQMVSVTSFSRGACEFKLVYSSCELPVFYCQSSAPFKVGGYEWRLEFYPNGISARHDDCAAAVLCLLSPVVPESGVPVRFTLSLLSEDGKEFSLNAAATVHPSKSFRVWEHPLTVKKLDIRYTNSFIVKCDLTVEIYLSRTVKLADVKNIDGEIFL